MANDIQKAAAILGKKGGKSTSAAKVAAVRENGKKGGRPPQKSFRIFSSWGSDFGSWRGETAAHALSKLHRESGYDDVKWDRENDLIVFPDDETREICGDVENWSIERSSR